MYSMRRIATGRLLVDTKRVNEMAKVTDHVILDTGNRGVFLGMNPR